MRAYGRVGWAALGVEGHAFVNRIIGRPAKAGGPGAEQPAVVSHHRGCPQPGRGQSLEDGRRSWYTAAGPVGQIGKPPGSRPDTVPFGELTGEQRAEARVRRRGEGGHPALGRSTALLGQAPHARREIGPNGAVGEPVEPEEHDPGHRALLTRGRVLPRPSRSAPGPGAAPAAPGCRRGGDRKSVV